MRLTSCIDKYLQRVRSVLWHAPPHLTRPSDTHRCALCGARNLSPTLTGVSAAREPELTCAVVEYAEPFAQPRQAELPPECAPLALFVVDEHAGVEAMRDVRAAAAAALAQMPPSACVGSSSWRRRQRSVNLHPRLRYALFLQRACRTYC